jgi:hypothetical protein
MVSLQPAGEARLSAAASAVLGRHRFAVDPALATTATALPGAADGDGAAASDGTGVYGRIDLRADRQSLPRFPSTASRLTIDGEVPLVRSPGDTGLEGIAVEGGLQTGDPVPGLAGWSDNLRLVLNAESLSGRVSTGAARAPVTEPVAVDFTGVDPSSAVARVVLPPGGDVRSRIEARTTDRSVRVGAAWDWGSGEEGDGGRLGSSLMLGYGEMAQDIRRSDSFASGQTSIDDVTLDQERATVDLSLFGQRPFGHGRFSLYGEMGLRWQHATADMESSYRYRDPAADGVALTTRDSLSDSSIGAFAEIELGYRVGKSTVLSVSAKVAGGNAVPTLRPPDASTGQEIRLSQSDDELRESFGIGLIHAF